MFGTYLRRELLNRRKQTIIIAIGMALAIALVIIVDAVSAGVRQAQESVLQSVYGVGTDITVSQPATAQNASGLQGAGGGPRFDFGADAGTETGAGRQVNTSRLEPTRGATVMDASTLTTVKKVDNVQAAAAVLSLTNTSFSGTLPNFQQLRQERESGQGGQPTAPPTGGSDGAGGSSFTVDSFSVLGLDPTGTSVGPLASVTLTGGRSFTSADAGKDVVVLDASYAKTASKAVGDTVTIGGTDFSVIGIVAATGSDATTAANAYIPLDVAQTLSGQTGKISSVYVKAASSGDIDQIKTDLTKSVSGATVSTQADLASTVSGSLGSAGQLIANLGTWLSVIVLAAAFLIAILFTISGVTRRTREFGTLKAIGWSNRRIVGQVAGESVVQGVIGGVIGVAVGLLGVLVVNLISPTLTGSIGRGTTGAAGVRPAAEGAAAGGTGEGAARGFGGAFGAAREAATSSANIALHAPVTLWIIVGAVGLAVLGGLLAGAIGGWRASRLRPAAALRSVA
ncbi:MULTISPECIES: ABC transporter permease [Leifsonia]|uniref:ABC-type antimicrobial peptide transport system permease subunit n=1 Tax=Leifsonia soli TaxID=582665 RepID=A0A852T3E1_9MICO|nr:MULTISPECIES: ABC transporter permease [Leifsonia]NYD76168.1 ABC-type antimicrobial peptide transport system permease subunit [Leifsonia soli]SEB04609.1 ABC-type transport system, involved in lipoprotein release, permease component [Leifsonia sp. 21MFCrub1.1]